MLYVAQSRAEQVEASLEVGFSAALATLAVALLSHLWLRSRAVQELAPLDRLSSRLKTHDLLAPGATLGEAERMELQPVHDALDALATQLGQRLAHERAFNAHAAHALRTPLAGIDAQIAVALREAPPHLQPRLQRVRAAAGRLQRVVAALLALFRSGVSLQREAVDLPALMQRLPVDGLEVTVQATALVQADVDLLSAALLNLLDNAVRHGAHRLTIATPGPDRLLLTDDGPGVDDARRLALAAALAAEVGGAAAADPATTQPPTDPDPGLGLGLKLAALVAQAHGGTLALPPTTQGFAVELDLQSRR
jgi:signal transduction histidine kinase